LSVFSAGFPLWVAELLDAVEGSVDGKRGGRVSDSLSGVDAVVLDDAVDVVAGVGVLRFVNALFPAAQGGVATVVAEVKNCEAPFIVFAGLLFRLAVLLNAVLRSEEDQRSIFGLIASLGLSAFGHIDGCLAALTGEAKGPAAGFSAALFLAVLESSGTFRVLLASSPLGGALLLNALLRICYSFLDSEGSGEENEGNDKDCLFHMEIFNQ
jgi:hypothetical protein